MPYSAEFRKDFNRFFLATGDYKKCLEKLCKKYPEERKAGKYELKPGDPDALAVLRKMKSNMIHRETWSHGKPKKAKKAKSRDGIDRGELKRAALELEKSGVPQREWRGSLQEVFPGQNVPCLSTLLKVMRGGNGSSQTAKIYVIHGDEELPLSADRQKINRVLRKAVDQGDRVTLKFSKNSDILDIIKEVL